jgi:hypothetical protein
MQTRGRRATVSIFALVLAVLAGCASVARASPGDSFCDYWAAHLTCVAIQDAPTCDANSLCTHNGSDCELTDQGAHQMSVLAKTAPQSVALAMQLQTCTAITSAGECTGYCAWDDNCLFADSFYTATYATCYKPETETSSGDSFCDYWAAHLTCVAIWDATTCDANSLCTHNGSDCELTDESTHQTSILAESGLQSVALAMQLQTCTAITSAGECTGYCAWDDGNCLPADSFFTATYATCYKPETETSGTKCPETSGASRVGAGTATFVAGAVATAGLFLA